MKKTFLRLATLAISLGLAAQSAFAAVTITNGTSSNDSSYLYYQFNYTGTPLNYRVWIEADGNARFGHQVAGIGADFLIENGNFYQFTSDDIKSLIGQTTFASTSGGVVQYSINMSLLGTYYSYLREIGFTIVFEVSDGTSTAQQKIYQTYNKPTPPAPTYTQPMRVWNQAYQENYQADTISEILASARRSYTLVDPFGSSEAALAIPTIKKNGNLVGCYISVGTCEDWRDDYAQMKPYCVPTQWGEWPGEYFVNTTTTGVLDIMKKRVDKMAAWGCDMVEFDNMDWAYDSAFRSTYKFVVTQAEAAAYNQNLCTYVKSKGMKCMAKNSTQNAENFDGLTLESYNYEKNWWDPAILTNMLNAGKIGVIVHYDETDCDGVYATYKSQYGNKVSYICEDRAMKKYKHYN